MIIASRNFSREADAGPSISDRQSVVDHRQVVPAAPAVVFLAHLHRVLEPEAELTPLVMEVDCRDGAP